MRKPRGKEMRRYLVSVTALVMVLLLAVILYMSIDSIMRINREMDKEKTRVVEQLVESFSTTLQGNAIAGQDEVLMNSVFKEDLVTSNDMSKRLLLLNFLAEMERNQFDAEYLTYVSNGTVITKSVAPGWNITNFSTTLPEDSDKDYVILNELGGKQGYFISVFADFPIAGYGEEFVNFAVDRTDQINALEEQYSKEKSNLITRQIIIGVIILLLGGLISALGVYYLTRRDITGPIEEINLISDQIMDGTFEGGIDVNEDSDFASLQALLSSGKKILDKMNELQE